MSPTSKLAVVAARLRLPTLICGVLLVVTSPLHGQPVVSWAGAVLVAASVLSTFVRGLAGRREPVVVEVPVRGRWIAINSPADKVPSHGVHSTGQTYAIDLVHWPDPGTVWTPVHRWPLMRRPEDFPGFGQPVLAPADGRVVRTSNSWRDHWSRNFWPALLYAFVEGSARELLGPGALLGNHVILDLGDGTYAALAHLRRGRSPSRRDRSYAPGSSWLSAGTPATRASPTCTSS